MTLLLIALIAVPAAAFVLWPFLRKRPGSAGFLAVAPGGARAGELNEEKAAVYRALHEIEFDYRAGHLSDDDYQALRGRYEARAAQLLGELDRLGATPEEVEATPPSPPGRPRAWTRSPATLAVGAVVLVIFGVTIGLGVSRYTEPDRTVVPPGARLPVPVEAPASPEVSVASPGGGDASRPLPPEVLAGMLQAARQSLFEGRYQEAIAAYQAVLKRDPKNVDAVTHLALIVAIGGHTDSALETLDKALAVDPNYPPAYLYRGQILYEGKKDYLGAVKAWEKFLSVVQDGEERARVTRMIEEARGQLRSQPR
jgi:tetratricopeptide (TPR) repeat protein